MKDHNTKVGMRDTTDIAHINIVANMVEVALVSNNNAPCIDCKILNSFYYLTVCNIVQWVKALSYAR